jgi:hypothetical protein
MILLMVPFDCKINVASHEFVFLILVATLTEGWQISMNKTGE